MAVGYQGGDDVVIYRMFQPLIGQLERNQQLQAKRAEEEGKQRNALNNELSKDIAKISSNGLRSADLDSFNEGYEKIKEIYFEIQKTKSLPDVRRLQASLNEQIGEVTSLVANSKRLADLEIRYANNLPQMVGKGKVDEARSNLNRLISTPQSKINNEDFDLSKYYYGWDDNKVQSAVKGLSDRLLKDPNSRVVSELKGREFETQGGRRYEDKVDSITVKDESLFSGLSNLAESNKDVKAYVQNIMDETGMDYNEAILTMGQDLVQQGYFSTVKEQTLQSDKSAPRTTNIFVGDQVPNIVDQGRRNISLGSTNTSDGFTFGRNVTIQGDANIINPENRSSVTSARNSFEFEAKNLMILPVNSNGNIVETNKSGEPVRPNEVARYEVFLSGKAVDPESISISEEVFTPQIKGVLKKDILLPYNNLDFISMPKGQAESLYSIKNLAEQKTQGLRTNRPQQTQPNLTGGRVR